MQQEWLQFIPPDFKQCLTVWGTKLVISLLTFAGFIVASIVVKKIIGRLARKSGPQKEQVLLLIGDVARIALFLFGLVTGLGTLGINVSALVAGLGLTGFALGFAFRDALSNVLAGLMILMYHPFHRGERVIITGLEGEVTRIDLRYTTLKNDQKCFLIPNSLLLTNPLIINRPSESKAA